MHIRRCTLFSAKILYHLRGSRTRRNVCVPVIFVPIFKKKERMIVKWLIPNTHRTSTATSRQKSGTAQRKRHEAPDHPALQEIQQGSGTESKRYGRIGQKQVLHPAVRYMCPGICQTLAGCVQNLPRRKYQGYVPEHHRAALKLPGNGQGNRSNADPCHACPQ